MTAQLAYAKIPGTRWRMPAKWYRVDVGDGPGRLTILALDSNVVPGHLAADEHREQQAWLEEQLAAARGTFTMVMAHHPVFSNGAYGDTPHLVHGWAPLLERHKVHVFLSGHEHDLQHLKLADRFTSFVISGGVAISRATAGGRNGRRPSVVRRTASPTCTWRTRP